MSDAFGITYVVDEAEIEAFYAAIGRAIVSWQSVESGLYELYEAAILPEIPGAAAAAFHAMQTTRLKVAAVDMAVGFVLLKEPGTANTWKKLKERILSESARRNSLAHGEVNVHRHLKERSKRIQLTCQFADVGRKAGLKKHNDIGLAQINEANIRFVELAKSVREYVRHILSITRTWRAKPPL